MIQLNLIQLLIRLHSILMKLVLVTVYALMQQKKLPWHLCELIWRGIIIK